jgi:FAD synthetase
VLEIYSVMKTVLVFGSFDIVHPGHLDFFRQAKEHGDKLYVVIARDQTIEAVKGRKPQNPELKRKWDVEQLDIVDKAILGNLGDPYSILSEIKPDVICLGYDQSSFTSNLDAELKKRGLTAEIIRLKPFFPEKYKSSHFRPSHT